MNHFQYRRARELDDEKHQRQIAASTWIVVFLGVAALALMGYMTIWGKHGYRDPQSVLLVIFLTAHAISWAGAGVNIFRWRDADLLDIDEEAPPPPTSDASDILDFGQTHSPSTPHLEYRHGNTIELGYISLTRRQWHALVTELKHNSPGKNNVITWSRRKMEKHQMPEIDGTDWEVFTGLTARNELGVTKFTVLTKELQSLRIVNRAGKAITDSGWQELCRVSGLDVVL